MCLIFIALKQHPDYKLIIAANRDEFYNRKTAAADFWKDDPNILGGRDLEAGGTWLGMNRNGRISFITNYRDPKNINPNAPSRGALVSDFLRGSTPASAYLKNVVENAKAYNGFNLVVGHPEELQYFSNYREGISALSEGLFGLSNHLLDSSWPKVVKGKERLRSLLDRKLNVADLFNLLSDEGIASDDLLPDTGIGLLRERALSSMFIKTVGYGTRCSTVILIDNNNHVRFEERVYDLETFQYTTGQYNFKIESSNNERR